MNADRARNIAAGITRDLARAIVTLQSLTAAESPQERLNGSSPPQDTGEVPTGQQEMAEVEIERDSYRKRWHEAATQRNTLVRVARALLDVPADQPNNAEVDDLRAAVELFETRREPAAGHSADRLRRELWHVLDRMPASDADLIATVKKLVEVEKSVEARRGENAP